MREKKTFCFEKVQEANKDLLVDAFSFGSYPAKQKWVFAQAWKTNSENYSNCSTLQSLLSRFESS